MMESFLTVLQWAFPSGLSIVNIFLLRALWKRNKSKITKETIDVWKQIADSNNEALLRSNNIIVENNETILHLKMSLAQLDSNTARLEQMLQLIAACRYYDHCPVRPELQKYKNSRKRASKPPLYHRKTERKTNSDSGESDGDGGSADELEEPATGGEFLGTVGDESHDRAF